MNPLFLTLGLVVAVITCTVWLITRHRKTHQDGGDEGQATERMSRFLDETTFKGCLERALANLNGMLANPKLQERFRKLDVSQTEIWVVRDKIVDQVEKDFAHQPQHWMEHLINTTIHHRIRGEIRRLPQGDKMRKCLMVVRDVWRTNYMPRPEEASDDAEPFQHHSTVLATR